MLSSIPHSSDTSIWPEFAWCGVRVVLVQFIGKFSSSLNFRSVRFELIFKLVQKRISHI
jgi:hypothetical protein